MCDMCNKKPDPKNYATAEEIAAAIAEAARIKTVNLTEAAIPQAIIDLVPEWMARKHVVIPVAWEDGVLFIAISDRSECETIDLLKYYLNREIQPVLARREQIIAAISKHYC